MAKIAKEEIKNFAREHKIAMYSAKMVLKKKWTLEYAKTLEYPVFNKGVSWLLEAKKNKVLLAFKTFKKGCIRGFVVRVRKYNNLIESHGKLKYVEKINTAYIAKSKDYKFLRKYSSIDPFVKDLKEVPSYKPSDRKEVDFSMVKKGTPVMVTLFTGEVFEGIVGWTTEYEFELKLDVDLSIIILKHAVWDVIDLASYEFPRYPREEFKKYRRAGRKNLNTRRRGRINKKY